MPDILDITAAGPDSRARRLVFSDGFEPRLTSSVVVRELGLAVGQSVELEHLNTDLALSEAVQCRERALRVISYRERSVSELRKRLLDDGYPHAVVECTLGRLIEIELIDDERFARAFMRARMFAGVGMNRIRHELAFKGVAPDLLADVLEHDDSASETTELERATRALGDRPLRDRKSRDKALARLIRRGFDFAVAREAIFRASSDASGADDIAP